MRVFHITWVRLVALLTVMVAIGVGFMYWRGWQQSEHSELVILGHNDLGMHCIQPDYSKFFILPVGNNLVVQVFERSDESELVTDGIRVKYEINSQDDPAKYSNFWRYAGKYGFDVAEGVGVTGNGPEGFMRLDPTGRFWVATAVPVTSLSGGTGPASPYQTATITVLDEDTDKVLAEFDKLVVPVSPEMDCLNCHKSWAGILRDHDKGEGTHLFDDSLHGVLHRCSECHADPILDASGKAGLPSLSLAMHGFHASRMTGKVEPVCYNCHPGEKTACNRGVMRANNVRCEDCHGGMAQVAASIKAGRTPWLQEIDCEKCHEAKYQVNPGQLYKNSFLLNSPDSDMNNKIMCATCHNSTHAEWPSLLQLDNILPETYQGEATYIRKCSVCHNNGISRVHR